MRIFPVAIIGLAASALPAVAQVDVDFSGTVSETCALSAETDGTLALNAGGNILSSDNVGGLAGSVTILSIGVDNTIEVAAPTRILEPVAYVDTNEVLEVSYSGAGGLSLVNQSYTSSTTTFDVDTIAASVLTVHNRITNPDGFAAGDYTTRTVVSCLP